MYTISDYGTMLRDRRRIDLYRKALTASISSSSIVLDLGAGLGTFGILAASLGAARVYAVDSSPVIAVAEENAKRSGVADRMTFLRAAGEELQLPEKVDVIISELSGALPIFENHLPAVMHAREQLLEPGGILIPRSSRLLCAPVSLPDIHSEMNSRWMSVEGVDFSAVASMSLHSPVPLMVKPDDLAGEPRCWSQLDYASIASPNVKGYAEWRMREDRTINGVALWFETEVSEGLIYESGPWSMGSIHATMILPLLAPRLMKEGEIFAISIEAILVSGHYVTTWQERGGAMQSTFFAEAISEESLENRTASASPERNTIEPLVRNRSFIVSGRVLTRRAGRELLILNLDSASFLVLNETASCVWEELERGGTAESAARALAASYVVDESRAGAEVRGLLAMLAGERLIRDGDVGENHG